MYKVVEINPDRFWHHWIWMDVTGIGEKPPLAPPGRQSQSIRYVQDSRAEQMKAKVDGLFTGVPTTQAEIRHLRPPHVLD